MVKAGPRMARAELRTLLVTTGMTVLREEGMRVGLDHLTFPKVFDRVERDGGRRITRASVYDRLWANQEEYQWEVLAHLIEDAAPSSRSTTRRVDAMLDTADTSSRHARVDALCRVCQIAVEDHAAQSTNHRDHRIIVAAAGAISSSNADAPPSALETRVRESLQQFLEDGTSRHIDLYTTIAARLGFRLRAPLEPRHLALAIEALGEGIALRLEFFPEYLTPLERPATQPAEAASTTSLAGLGAEAIATSMLELDPDWHRPR